MVTTCDVVAAIAGVLLTFWFLFFPIPRKPPPRFRKHRGLVKEYTRDCSYKHTEGAKADARNDR